MSIYAKMQAIATEIAPVAKSHTNAFHKYAYRSGDDVLAAVKEQLVKHKVNMQVSVVSSAYYPAEEGGVTTVQTRCLFTDLDDEDRTQNFCEVYGAGQGVDKGDKGLYKALTGALKYVLMHNFYIPGSEDAEADSPVVKKPGVAKHGNAPNLRDMRGDK